MNKLIHENLHLYIEHIYCLYVLISVRKMYSNAAFNDKIIFTQLYHLVYFFQT